MGVLTVCFRLFCNGFLFDSLAAAMSRESNRKDLVAFVFRVIRRERLASSAWLRWNVLFWCRSLCASAEVLSVVEARRFRPRGLAVVAALAQAAHALRVVGVQACFDELDAFNRPMVGYGAGGTAYAMVSSASVRPVAGTDAPRVPCQHAGACEAMRFRRVWIAASCPALVFGFPTFVAQRAGGDQVWATGGGAYLVHQSPTSVRSVRHVLGTSPAKVPQLATPDSWAADATGVAAMVDVLRCDGSKGC